MELYYPCSENKGADQLRSYCEAGLRLCFLISVICRLFSHDAAQIISDVCCFPLLSFGGFHLKFKGHQFSVPISVYVTRNLCKPKSLLYLENHYTFAYQEHGYVLGGARP